MRWNVLSCLLVLGWVGGAPHGALWAADWPTYRADSARSGYVEESLPAELQLRWTWRSSDPPQRSWPRSDRMTFDRAFQAVAAAGSVYFGSSVDGKVYALDEIGRAHV